MRIENYSCMGCKRNEHTFRKENITYFGKILKNKSEWIQHVHRMQRDTSETVNKLLIAPLKRLLGD
jgi:hypothetical protein